MKTPEREIIPRIVSELATVHGLLNCLIKEFALPERCIAYEWPQDIQGMPPGGCLHGLNRQGIPLTIHLPCGRQFFVLVDRRDRFGSQRYLSDLYFRQGRGIWSSPGFATLVEQILEGCQRMTGTRNEELSDQVLRSRQLMASILSHHMGSQRKIPLTDYLDSEQGLWFGHPNHPAPKARLWPDHLGQEAFAPEFRVCTPLYQFEVPLEGLKVKANGLSETEALAGVADQSGARPGHALIAMHPVQAQLFMQDARVQALLAQGVIADRGTTGFMAGPTASIRTWYVEGHDYFIKGSLNVRITNCVRKNAWYELESALLIDRLFRQIRRSRPDSLKEAAVVSEPAILSWSPTQAGKEDRRWFAEQTGIILRDNFCLRHGAENCLLAGTLFARDTLLQPLIQGFLESVCARQIDDEALLQWFDDYQRLLLNPVMSLFFNYGIVMEPHLQNTVLIHERGQPRQLLLRDFEGVKLTNDPGILLIDEDIHPRVRQSLVYSRAQGWNRIVYCLFINNLSEAVLALSWDRPALATRMWQRVEQQLHRIRGELNGPAPELDALIAGAPLACKTNLKVRLAAQADRQAGYVQLSSPWCREVAYA